MNPGARLGPYQIIAAIGAGGMGEVWRACDTRLGRDVAIKILPPEFAADPERLRRFEREARATAVLDHPNILAVHDVGTHEGTPYIVEQLLEGESLRARLAGGALPTREALEIGVQIAQGLAAAHARGIIHRDLKPENVFITTDGVVKILDFGLAKLMDPSPPGQAATLTQAPTGVTAPGRVLGTVAYMAPEQARGVSVDQRADIFAFGILLYELLSGQRPFTGQTYTDVVAAILKEEPAPLPERVPAALQGLVLRCLEKRPADRFSTAHDLALALQAVASPSAPRSTSVATARLTADAPARGMETTIARPRSLRLLRGRAGVALAGLALALLGGFGVWRLAVWRQAAWARDKGLPELVRLTEAQQHVEAFRLATRIEAVLPGDPRLGSLWPQIAGEFKRLIRPLGAKVYVRQTGGGEADWIFVGEAAGKPLRLPLGHAELRIEHPGMGPVELGVVTREFDWDGFSDFAAVILAPKGELPPGMARIETGAGKFPFGLFGAGEVLQAEHLGSFLADRSEVTNSEYKRFVDGGGYGRQEYWQEPFEKDGKAITWAEAMGLFRDATGRTGPATWEVGSYPEGKDDFPVTGVSWYEAAAYARFAGKRLPTIYHWSLAASQVVSADIAAGSNFSGSLAPVGSFRGSLNLHGLYDIAGNAREWCSNAVGANRFVLGAACDDPVHTFFYTAERPPFDRDPTTGFRCVKPLAPDPLAAQLERPIVRKAEQPVDSTQQKPFGEDAWQTWQGLLAYEKERALEARVEWTDDSFPSWRMEKVTFTAAYADERVTAYLFLPRSVAPPWQVVVFWPGAYAGLSSSSQDGRNTLDTSYWSYLVRDGRAVLYPILKGTFERGGNLKWDMGPSMDHCIFELKDVFRSLDYLETRPDIRADRIGYLGFSWGAIAGPFLGAFEQRIKAAILLGGVLYEAQILGFAARWKAPVQMVNARMGGEEDRATPLFRAVGAPPEHKRLLIFDTDHSLAGFEKEIIKANLEWLDRYLGPVK